MCTSISKIEFESGLFEFHCVVCDLQVSRKHQKINLSAIIRILKKIIDKRIAETYCNTNFLKVSRIFNITASTGENHLRKPNQLQIIDATSLSFYGRSNIQYFKLIGVQFKLNGEFSQNFTIRKLITSYEVAYNGFKCNITCEDRLQHLIFNKLYMSFCISEMNKNNLFLKMYRYYNPVFKICNSVIDIRF